MKENQPATHLLDFLRQQPYDLRLEVILAELLDHGHTLEEFLVRPLGLFARRYRRDLGEVYEEKFERARRQVVRTVLEVHREGLYDALPQQLFHQPGAASGTPGTASMIEEIRRQRQKERATRQFFLPLEQEFFRCRVRIEQEERRYLANVSAQWYNETMARFWGIADACLPAGPLSSLLYLLPLAHGLVGDLPRTQRCFESVLGHPVSFRVVTPLQFALPAAPKASMGGAALGDLALGVDLVLGGDYREVLPALEVSLLELSVSELEAYLNQEWPARALSLLLEYFVAFETDVTLVYGLAQSTPSFLLGEGAQSAVLGYTTAGI
ncbi:type VI secretion system baseplate subunit TssG [Hymenobacter sp. UYCo722]|uniref:type VI secretion system baseplate subunit TssG n=1 Tax=Hymenobacter sp. UYCo722 TaxID=3156335 RepID=UPI003390BDF8